MPNATVAAAGNVTIQTTGEQTGRFLSAVSRLVTQTNRVIEYTGVSPIPGAAAGPFTLAVPATGYPNAAGAQNLTLAGGTQALVQAGANVALSTGGNAVASAAGAVAIDASAPGNLVDSFGNDATVIDAGAAATVAAGGVGNTVFMNGNGQYLFADSGSTGTYTEFTSTVPGSSTVIGGGNIFVIGSYGADQPTVPSGTSALELANSNYVGVLDPSARAVVVMYGTANTISAAAGAATVFGVTGGDVVSASGGSASTTFVGSTGAVVGVSTVSGGSGNDVVFAQSGVNYTAGAGANIYVGGTVSELAAADSVASPSFSHSTVTGTTGHDTLFGGTVGDLYNVGGAADLLVNGGGADTIFGGSVAPTLFGNTGGSDQLVNTRGGSALVANGAGGVIDAAAAGQGNSFFVANVASLGNATLVGSANAPAAASFDQFVIASVAGASAVAHTVTIEDYQAGDAMFLVGYTGADDQSFAAAVAANVGQGSLTFTLSDNTTIQFVGSRPTATFNGGIVAL